jgi:hypothetical protein
VNERVDPVRLAVKVRGGFGDADPRLRFRPVSILYEDLRDALAIASSASAGTAS